MSIFKRNQDPPYNTRSPVHDSPQGDRSGVASPAEFATRPTPAALPGTPPDPASFSPAGPTAQPVAPLDPHASAAVLDNKTEITGTLHSNGNVLIEGCFEGEIEARETVWVEKGAQSRGQLRAKDVVISGSVDGEITCEHRLQITATAVVTGGINTPVLVIDEGATINCRFTMARTGG